MTSAILSAPSVSVRAPAKVNLELRVGPPRPDGFHPL
ncbi:MAG TPA: 4-(cytidine 5'-diphospho)-2-C-methyl-D-erythritol kinase, partial [Intrasporangiaceae bacterium]|nr:4-(cytidine 5'-diphospho)-2-C-methyl-D-erythritol kinase [Intrasporangiaceae bacterium]